MSGQDLQETIETRLREFDPEVELIALEQPAAETLRLYIDRPGGVDLALCEAVTGELRDLLERLLARGLFARHRPAVDQAGALPPLPRPPRKGTHARADRGARNFTGTLAEADDESVMVAAEGAPVRIPLNGIKRSNLIGELEFGGES